MNHFKAITITLLLISHVIPDGYAQEQTWWQWLFGIDVVDNYPDGDVKYLERRIDLERPWLFKIGDNAQWIYPDYDDSQWESIDVPSPWENQGFHGYDGSATYRVHFDGSSLNQDQLHYAVLGFIDDVDIAFLNGEIIGQSGRFPPKFKTAYNANRVYRIPQYLINYHGDNILTIRIYDQVLNGGIIDGKIGIYASPFSSIFEQELFGRWKFTRRKGDHFKRTDYNDNHWDDLYVPSFWDNQGYRSFDGSAWYRKTFNLAFVPDQYKSYYLVLGKIDDFDLTYINGVLIGQTNDAKPFGKSESYKEIRMYQIPNGVLQAGQKNVVAVKVIDIGYNGGMYEGPVGIVEESNLDKLKLKK